MGNLASTYGALGEHNDALQLQKDTLEFQQRVLPEDHRDIAQSKSNMAETNRALGQHNEALQLMKETLSVRQRMLPEDPMIELTMNNLALTYGRLGNTMRRCSFRKRRLNFGNASYTRIIPPLQHQWATWQELTVCLGNVTRRCSFRKRRLLLMVVGVCAG
jgi:tetratricopeptide (TPR) repeat protein